MMVLICCSEYGLTRTRKARWCVGCAVEGAVSLTKRKMCEGCGLKAPSTGLALEGKARCAGCGKLEGAVTLRKIPKKQKIADAEAVAI